jgi:hypothetical protein
MARKARAGHVTRGRVYGSDNTDVGASDVTPDGTRRRLHVIRVVNEEQAAVVRRIFQLCAGGLGLTRIEGRSGFYGCGYYHKRGRTVCKNKLLIRQDLLDQAVIQAISFLDLARFRCQKSYRDRDPQTTFRRALLGCCARIPRRYRPHTKPVFVPEAS